MARPLMDPKIVRRNFTFKIAPDLREWLDKMRADGYSKSSVIHNAMREYREKLKR